MVAKFQPDQEKTEGFGRLAHVIRDFWMVILTEAELKVLLYIDRKTAGWGRRTAAIPYAHFISGQAGQDLGAGVNRQAVAEALAVLKGVGLLFVVSERNARGNKCANIYGIHYDCPIDGARERIKALRGEVRAERIRKERERKSLSMHSIPHESKSLSMHSTHREYAVHTKGSCLVRYAQHTDSEERYLYQRQQQHPCSGAKGGLASSPVLPDLPPAAVAPSGSVGGGDPRTPSHIDRLLPVAEPPGRQEEGAASRQETTSADEDLLTPADRAEIDAFTRNFPEKQAAQLRAMFIQGKREDAARRASGFVPEPWVHPENRKAPVRPQDRREAASTGFVDCRDLLGTKAYQKFAEIESCEALVGEMVEIGVEKPLAKSLLSTHGEGKVSQWIERSMTKNDPAAYLVRLAQIEAKKAGKSFSSSRSR